jgi:outer membrane protein TolC
MTGAGCSSAGFVWRVLAGIGAFILLNNACSSNGAASPTNQTRVQPLPLRQAIHIALGNNRLLQIEQINPEIQRASLSDAYGFYDPVFVAQADRERTSDTGGFDPADPSADVAFQTESEVLRMGLTGFLPSGLSYTLGADYAHSTGSRDFLNIDAYRLTGTVLLRQPLLKNFWIDAPRLTIRVNRNNVKISEYGVRFVAMEVINQVRQAYYELAFAWSNLRVQQDLLQTRSDFLRGIRRQIEVGTITVLEEKLAQSQEATVKTTLINASNQVVLASNGLKTLLGYTATNWADGLLVPADSLLILPEPFDLPSSWQRGLTYRPDLAQLVREVDNANLNVKYRRNQLFPSLDIIGGYGRRGSSSLSVFPPDTATASFSEAFGQIERGDNPSDMVGLILSFPLSRTSERANFRASKHLKSQALLRVKEKEEMVLREVSDAIETARSSYERVHAAREASQFAEDALRAEEQKLLSGKSSAFLVLQLQSDLSIARTAELLAKRDYNQALAQLHFAEGTILDHEKINLEIK